MAMVLFNILKWVLRAVFTVLKTAFCTAKLLLLLFVLAVSGISSIAGVTSGRR